jgi:endogenous inhibitor of DNA gyrase (YacG/DUF329 family)
MEPSDPPEEPRGRCPICSRPTERAYRPFCSRRCADVDLARWLRGAYAIPDETGRGDTHHAAGPGDTAGGSSSDERDER